MNQRRKAKLRQKIDQWLKDEKAGVKQDPPQVTEQERKYILKYLNTL